MTQGLTARSKYCIQFNFVYYFPIHLILVSEIPCAECINNLDTNHLFHWRVSIGGRSKQTFSRKYDVTFEPVHTRPGVFATKYDIIGHMGSEVYLC